MKKTSVQNLIINALLLVEAVLIVFFLLRMITKPRDKEAGPVVPDRELTIAEQEGIEPVEPVVGNSKPVDVEPVEGIRITAAENALDKDREFKITPVDEKTWDESEKRIAEASGQQMLFCFDLDADMEADERMPGYFTVALDLEEMGVPSIMHPYLSVWRLEGDQQDEYTSWVENGKLIFNSDQNCVISIAAVGWFFLDKVALLAVGITAGATLAWGYDKVTLPDKLPSLYKGYFSMEDDVSHIKLKHPSGDHTLYFRYSKTENGDRYEDFKTRKQDLKKRMAELEKMADEEYKRQLDAQYGKETFGWMKSWANARSRKAIDRAAILTALVEKDERIKEIKELFQLPRSIVDFGCQLIAANSFLTEQEDLNKPFWNVNVYLVGTEELGTDNGHLEFPFSAAPYLVLNYERMRGGANEYSRKGPGENMLLTVTHELYHYRQKKSQWITNMDFRTEETTAAYQEKTAYQYYLAKGEIVSRATDKSASFIEFSSRDNYEVFGRDFNHKIKKGEKGADESYTYADVMDYLQKKKGLEKPLKGKHIIQCYSDWTSHKSLYMDWFGIKDEKEFAGYIQGFCEENLEKIHGRQGMADIDKSLHLETYSVSPSNPVVDAKTVEGELIMRTFDIQGDPKGGRFHAFLVPGKACTAEEITFYSSNDIFVKDRKKGGLYFDADDFLYAGAYFKPNSSALPFKIVALYAPDAPVIKKVKKNYVRFVLPKADKDMVKKGYITGALVRCLSADGTERYILAQPEKFGKEVKWSIDGIGDSGFSLRVKWIRQNEDGSTYESPLSKPAAHGALPAEKEEPVTESANVGKEKDVEKKPKASQEGEEKLVIYEKVRDLPWRAVNVSLYLDELEKQELVDFDRKVCHVIGSFGWGNGVDYPYIAGQTEGMLDKGVYIHHPIKGLSVNSNVKFVETGEGYTLSGVMKESGDADGGSLKDGAYQLDVTLVFDEDLKLLKGKFEGSSKQMRKITFYRQPSSNGKNVVNYYRNNPWFPTDMVYSGSFTAEEIYSDSDSELLYYAKYDSLNMQGNWKEDAYTANKQFGEAVVEKHFSKGLSDAVSKGIKVKIELIKCED